MHSRWDGICAMLMVLTMAAVLTLAIVGIIAVGGYYVEGLHWHDKDQRIVKYENKLYQLQPMQRGCREVKDGKP